MRRLFEKKQFSINDKNTDLKNKFKEKVKWKYNAWNFNFIHSNRLLMNEIKY